MAELRRVSVAPEWEAQVEELRAQQEAAELRRRVAARFEEFGVLDAAKRIIDIPRLPEDVRAELHRRLQRFEDVLTPEGPPTVWMREALADIHALEVRAGTALPEPEATVAPAAAASPEPPPSPAPIQQTATPTDNRTIEELKQSTREIIDRLGSPHGIGKIVARELNIELRTAQRYVEKIKNDMSHTKTTPRQTASKAKKSKAKRGATPRRKRH